MTQALAQGIYIEDGYYVDPETGEITGLVEPKPQFTIDSESAAEWVLQKMTDEDIEIAALRTRMEVLAQNMTTMIKRREQRRQWLETRFSADLEEYAMHNLPKGKKSWVCPYGKVQFRSSPAKLKVEDQETVLKWAKESQPQAVKVTESFLISEVPDMVKAELMADPITATVMGFSVVPESETCTISTGVK